MRARTLPLFCLLWLASVASPAWAHHVIGIIYAEGNTVVAEVGFSDGSFGQGVGRLLGAEDALLDSAPTDEFGVVRFAWQEAAERIHVDLGGGHAITLALDSLHADRQASKAVIEELATEVPIDPAIDAALSPLSTAQLSALIEAATEAAVARQVRPLQREIAAMKEAFGWRDIIGGLGVLVGVFGFAAAYLARRART